MYKKSNGHSVHIAQIMIFFFAILITAPALTSMASNWSDLVKNNIYMENPRTLNGKAFLDQPIVDATVDIYDKDGTLLFSTLFSTDENGSFSITEPLPETFLIVIRDGLINGEPFDYEVKRYVYNFNKEDLYKLNAITTLMTEYHDRHPDLSFAEVGEVVAKYLSIPDSEDINDIIYCSEWHCNSFSHYKFMEEAQEAGGFTVLIERSCDAMEYFVLALPPGSSIEPMYSAGGSIGSIILKRALIELASGATHGVGSQAGGLLLNILFQDPGSDETNARLDDIQNSLEAIKSQLVQIQNSLNKLLSELQISTNEIETYIVVATITDEINEIMNAFDELMEFNELPENIVKQKIEDFAERYSDFRTAVLAINSSIVPNLYGQGLLDLCTESFMLKGLVEKDSLMDCYMALEQYFSEILLFQFQGVNLVVETSNYDYDYESAGENDRSPGSVYLEYTYSQYLKEQTDNFMRNVARLIVNGCDIGSNQDFNDDGIAQRIIARANWFTTQILGEELNGYWVSIIGPSSLVDDMELVRSGASPFTLSDDMESLGVDKYFWSSQSKNEPQTFTVDGPPVDTWGNLYGEDLLTLRKDDSYTLLIFNFGDDPSIGDGNDINTRAVKYSNPSTDISYLLERTPPLTQKSYSENYDYDSSGDISYACALYNFWSGGANLMMDSLYFMPHFLKINGRDITGQAPEVLRPLANSYLDQNLFYSHLTVGGTTYSGTGENTLDEEWWHKFNFEGEDATAYLNINHILGGLTIGAEFNAKSEKGYRIGIYDVDLKKVLNEVTKTYSSHGSFSTVLPPDLLSTTISFDLRSGRDYYVFVRHWVTATGLNYNIPYNSELETMLLNLSLSFD